MVGVTSRPSPRNVSASARIDAPPAAVFDLLADPRRHAEIDGSGSVRGVAGGPQRLSLGARFGMDMKQGAPYRVTNRVVEFEEGRLIAWRHAGLHRWRYELTPDDGGTRVTETWDVSRYPTPAYWVLSALRFPQKTRAAIEGTLARLQQVLAEPA